MIEDEVLFPGQAAALSGVQIKSLRRWADAGLIPSSTTPGGHHRYRRGDMVELGVLMAGMTTAQVAALFGVDQKTVNRWVVEGRLAANKTPGGGDLRYRREDVETLLKGRAGNAS